MTNFRDHYLPPDPDAYRRAEPPTGRVIVIAPTRAACETIELAMQLDIETVLEREHGDEIRELAERGMGFGIVAGTGTGKTLAIRRIASQILKAPLKVGVVNREREATPETPTWNVVIVTTGIARRWFQDELIDPHDTLVVDEIHQTSAELELCLALGKRVGCRFIWLSATVDPSFYASYLNSEEILHTTAFDEALAARVETRFATPLEFLSDKFIRRVVKERRGVAVFLPTRAETEMIANEAAERWERLHAAFYHGGEPIRVIRPFLEGSTEKPFLLSMTQAGQSALNVHGLDTVVIYDACYNNVVDRGRNVLTRQYLGSNQILQMAGRVHGRVADGEVYILTDRDIDFDALQPTPPDFQLAGDSERVALTAAALKVDLAELDLPVPVDRQAYGAAVKNLTVRGLMEGSRLTQYGHDVEVMPVDRPWAELIVHADDDLVPYIAVMANIDSLHRMTREEHDLHGLVVHGSDHLTSYNIFAEAVAECGYVGEVYGLSRHLFRDALQDWAERRGVMVKVLEDVALGLASVYRTIEQPLVDHLPPLNKEIARRFRDLVAQVMPFAFVIEGEMPNGDRARLSQSSVCNPHSAVAGSVSYFADRFGVPRAAVEGTNIPFKLIQHYAIESGPTVEFRNGRKTGLFVTNAKEYFGFVLSRERHPMPTRFPPELASEARAVLARAIADGRTPHPDQGIIQRVMRMLNEYWKRSGATLHRLRPGEAERRLREQLRDVASWHDFMDTRVELSVDDFVAETERAALDLLPNSVKIGGDRVPVSYELEGSQPVARIKMREGQARMLRPNDLPRLDRPLRFSVFRGRHERIRASSLDELARRLSKLPAAKERRSRKPYRYRRRGR